MRIGCKLPNTSKTVVSAFQGKNEYGEDETVIVITNLGDTERSINFAGLDTSACNRISVNVTGKDHDLEETYYSEFRDGTAITVPAGSVVTVVISNRTAG